MEFMNSKLNRISKLLVSIEEDIEKEVQLRSDAVICEFINSLEIMVYPIGGSIQVAAYLPDSGVHGPNGYSGSGYSRVVEKRVDEKLTTPLLAALNGFRRAILEEEEITEARSIVKIIDKVIKNSV